jgi:hypothetical protein
MAALYLDRADNDLFAGNDDEDLENENVWFYAELAYRRKVVIGDEINYIFCFCNACDHEYENDYLTFSKHCRTCRCIDCVCPLMAKYGRYNLHIIPVGTLASCGECFMCQQNIIKGPVVLPPSLTREKRKTIDEEEESSEEDSDEEYDSYRRKYEPQTKFKCCMSERIRHEYEW